MWVWVGELIVAKLWLMGMCVLVGGTLKRGRGACFASRLLLIMLLVFSLWLDVFFCHSLSLP